MTNTSILKSLGTWQLATFGICCCERLIPCYEAHCKFAHVTVTVGLPRTLDAVGAAIIRQAPPDHADLTKHLRAIRESDIPAEPTSPYQAMAISALGSVEYLLEFLRD